MFYPGPAGVTDCRPQGWPFGGTLEETGSVQRWPGGVGTSEGHLHLHQGLQKLPGPSRNKGAVGSRRWGQSTGQGPKQPPLNCKSVCPSVHPVLLSAFSSGRIVKWLPSSRKKHTAQMGPRLRGTRSCGPHSHPWAHPAPSPSPACLQVHPSHPPPPPRKPLPHSTGTLEGPPLLAPPAPTTSALPASILPRGAPPPLSSSCTQWGPAGAPAPWSVVLSVASAQEGRAQQAPAGTSAELAGSLWPARPNQGQLKSLPSGRFAPLSAHPAPEGQGALQQPGGTDSSQASLGTELSQVGVG